MTEAVTYGGLGRGLGSGFRVSFELVKEIIDRGVSSKQSH